MSRPRLSVIICIYNMAREAPRTILSAALPYQKGIDLADYEVIVVDNGSTKPMRETDRNNLPPGVAFYSMPNPRPSPVFALNWAAKELARGDILLFAIDGARIFSDRLCASALAAHDLVEDAFVYTLSWHLGPKIQRVSMLEGYDAAVEDRLIAACDWPRCPRALFDISVLAGASSAGYFRRIGESNAFSIPRDLYHRLGGYDERFASPGGGLANHEIFKRYMTRPGAVNICLLSEGTFHQVHGGIATSRLAPAENMEIEYKQIVGEDRVKPSMVDYESFYYANGEMEFLRFLRLPKNPVAWKRDNGWRQNIKNILRRSLRRLHGPASC
jgi:glycosyltransferase involved in cell wall biosynthesis